MTNKQDIRTGGTDREIKIGDWVITDLGSEMDITPAFLVVNPPRQVTEILPPQKGIKKDIHTFMAHCPHEDDFACGEKISICKTQLIAIFDDFDSALAVYKTAKEKARRGHNVINALKKMMIESIQKAITQANGTSTIDADGEYINDE